MQRVPASQNSVQPALNSRPQKNSTELKNVSEPSSSKLRDVARIPALASGLEDLSFHLVETVPSQLTLSSQLTAPSKPTWGGVVEFPTVMEERLLSSLLGIHLEPQTSVSDSSEVAVGTTTKRNRTIPSRPKAVKKQQIVAQEPTRRSGRAKVVWKCYWETLLYFLCTSILLRIFGITW